MLNHVVKALAEWWVPFVDTKKESGTSEYTRLTALAPMKRCFFDRDTVKNAIYEKWLDGRLLIMNAGCFRRLKNVAMFSFCDIIEQKGGNGYEEIYSRYCNRCDFIMHGSFGGRLHRNGKYVSYSVKR